MSYISVQQTSLPPSTESISLYTPEQGAQIGKYAEQISAVRYALPLSRLNQSHLCNHTICYIML